MKLTLIITTYNWPAALLLVLKSVENQSIKPDELIIADDGSRDETKNLINKLKKDSNINIIHSWQEDIGFRAAKSRNKAILKSSGDYIVLIDGDTILHTNFIKDHINNAEFGFFVQGSRVLLTEKSTKKALAKKISRFSFFSLGLKNRKNSIHSNLLSLIFSNKNNYLRGIKAHNIAFYKQACIDINGFNNEFEGWGREDSEFAARLINSGLKRKNVRFNSIQFHLWHNDNSRTLLEKNDGILSDTLNNQKKWCENGINSIKE
tara:strand:+ start:753 stop:1541 length:789 start_codon:yes stop_codon:yes gene_type:complete